MLLEGAYRLVEFVVEELNRHMAAGRQVFVGIVEHSQRGQRSPYLGDGGAAVAAAHRIAVFAARTRHTKGPPGLLTSLTKTRTAIPNCRRSLPISGKRQANRRPSARVIAPARQSNP